MGVGVNNDILGFVEKGFKFVCGFFIEGWNFVFELFGFVISVVGYVVFFRYFIKNYDDIY